MIWGMTLEPGKLYTEIMGEEVQLSMAAIDSRKDLDESSKSFCQIVINTNKGEYVLCTLVHGVMFQQSLDLKLMPREKVTFSVQGPSVVYLVGYTASYPEDEGLEMEDEENLEAEEDTSAWEPFDQTEEDYFDQIKEEPSDMSEEAQEVTEIHPDEENQGEGGVSQVEQGAGDMEGSQNGREEEIIFSVPDLEPGDLKSEAPTPQPDSTPMGSQMAPQQMGQQGGMFDIQNPNTRTTMPPEPSQTPDFFYPETQQPPAVPITPPTAFQPTSSATDFQPPNPQGVLAPPETFVPTQRTMTQSRSQRHPHQGGRGGAQQMNIQRMQAHPSRQYGTNTNEPSSKSRGGRQPGRRASNIQSVPGTSKQDMPGPSSSSAGPDTMVPKETRAGLGCPHCHLIVTEAEFPNHSCFRNPINPRNRQSLQSKSSDSIPGPFSCRYCSKKYLYRMNCKRHEKIHLGLKPHVCRICSKAFHRTDYLNSHMRTHVRRVPNIEPGGECVVAEPELSSHPFTPNPLPTVREHVPLKPDNPDGGFFSCRYCSKKYGHRENCKRHERTHLGIKPHVCNICSKAFYRQDYLKNHMRTHSRSGDLGNIESLTDDTAGSSVETE